MPKRISGDPVTSTRYKGGHYDRPARPHACRLQGLPFGSSIGAVLEASLIRKAAEGDVAAQRIVVEWGNQSLSSPMVKRASHAANARPQFSSTSTSNWK